MKVCLAQINTAQNSIDKNIEYHLELSKAAIQQNADAIFFPELSLTGYEPNIAEKSANYLQNFSFENFQQLSNDNNITIGLGLPTKSNKGIYISMKIFQPNAPIETYSKQLLHIDELAYFVKGEKQVFIQNNTNKICPAICYESLQPEHSLNAYHQQANIYIASVAKPQKNVEQALNFFPKIAEKYSMITMMVNSVGYCDNFESMGTTSAWTATGKLIDQLSQQEECLLFVDTNTYKASKTLLSNN